MVVPRFVDILNTVDGLAVVRVLESKLALLPVGMFE